MGTRQPVTLD